MGYGDVASGAGYFGATAAGFGAALAGFGGSALLAETAACTGFVLVAVSLRTQEAR